MRLFGIYYVTYQIAPVSRFLAIWIDASYIGVLDVKIFGNSL
jgi:hypothetical protein